MWAVRDPAGSDPGTGDRRLLALEPEFVSVLKSAGREISTLSPTLRSAWDGRPLQLLTRTAPARSTDAHIALIGHITQAELRHHLTHVELANGLANRFLLCACRRTRLLPEGGSSDPLSGTGLIRVLGGAIRHARAAGRLRLDEQARELWRHAYTQLATAQPAGIAGALCARSEAHTIRLALLYALADGEPKIKAEHLQAALALWDYAARSATWALQGATGDPLAEQIHAALQHHPAGLSRSQISNTLQHNRPAGGHPARAPCAPARRPRDPPPDPHRRAARGALDRHTTGGLTTPPLPGHSRKIGAGRQRLSPSAARERKRSDLDRPAAGATTLQVRGGGAHPNTNGSNDFFRSFVPPSRHHPEPRQHAQIQRRSTIDQFQPLSPSWKDPEILARTLVESSLMDHGTLVA